MHGERRTISARTRWRKEIVMRSAARGLGARRPQTGPPMAGGDVLLGTLGAD
jgi:hypothetical protein